MLTATDLTIVLSETPDALYRAQTERDTATAAYEAYKVKLELKALSEPLFEGKDGLRPATNDRERQAAIDLVLARALANPRTKFARLTARKQAADRDVTLQRNRFEAALALAQLMPHIR